MDAIEKKKVGAKIQNSKFETHSENHIGGFSAPKILIKLINNVNDMFIWHKLERVINLPIC